MKARLLFREKVTLQSGLIREAVVWQVPKNERYPDGIRYRMALVDPFEKKLLLLFDNHYPKGHHVHFSDGREGVYIFQSLENLDKDYRDAAKVEAKNYENKKD